MIKGVPVEEVCSSTTIPGSVLYRVVLTEYRTGYNGGGGGQHYSGGGQSYGGGGGGGYDSQQGGGGGGRW